MLQWFREDDSTADELTKSKQTASLFRVLRPIHIPYKDGKNKSVIFKVTNKHE